MRRTLDCVQDMLAAPLDHWVHNMHDNEYFKDRSNPFFGETHLLAFCKMLPKKLNVRISSVDCQ